MRSLTLPLTLLASLAIAAPAFAASSTMSGDTMSKASTSSHMEKTAKTHVATGKIKSIDTSAKTLTLTNGKKFMLPADFTAASMKKGEHVRVSYRMSGKTMSATAVKAVN